MWLFWLLIVIAIALFVVAWRKGWDWRATLAALGAFGLAVLDAVFGLFSTGSVPSP